MFYQHLKGPMEAMLFAAGDPMPPERLSALLDIPIEHVQAIAQIAESVGISRASVYRALAEAT